MRAVFLLASVASAALLVSACSTNSDGKWGFGWDNKKPVSTGYTCDDGTRFNAVFKQDRAVVTMTDGQKLVLMQQPAASGTRYSSGVHELHTKGDEAIWTIGRRASVTCYANR